MPFRLAMIGVLIVASGSPAQNATEAERFELYLKNFESRMAGADTIAARCQRTEIHPLTKKATIFSGDIAFARPNKARIDLTHVDELDKKDPEKTRFERIICTGKHAIEYNAQDKSIVVHELPATKPGEEPAILALLKGMNTAELKKRFDISLAREDEWYAYVKLKPRRDADRQEFQAAELAIYIKNPNPRDKPDLTYLLAQLRWTEPNGREVRYLLSDMILNSKLDPEVFTARQIDGYKMKSSKMP